jgi:hypothetical protein
MHASIFTNVAYVRIVVRMLCCSVIASVVVFWLDRKSFTQHYVIWATRVILSILTSCISQCYSTIRHRYRQ